MVITFLMLALCGMAEATVASKQIKVDYNNITIYADGKAVNLSAGQEPFLLNGVTYVPLRVAGEALKSTVNWQADAKTIHITSGTSTEMNNLKVQLATKDQEIAGLKKQIDDLKKQLDEKSSKKSDKYDLRDLEDELLDEFDELVEVSIEDIILSGDEDEVEVEIEVDLDDYGDEWEDLRDREIENWLENVVEYIQDELTEDTVVEGVIINTDDDRELVEFEKDGDDNLEVKYKDTNYRGGKDKASEVADALLNDRYSVEELRFSVSKVSYDKDDDEVLVYLDALDRDCAERWEELGNRTIDNSMEDIGEDIAGEFEDEDVRVDTVRLYFYDENKKLLDSLKYSV